MSILVAAVAVVALGGGLAYAYWTAGGSGTGSATTGTSAGFTIASTAPTGGLLTPGGVTDTVAFTVTNPGPGVQHLSNVAVSIAGPTGTAWTAVSGCSALDYTVGTPAITYADIAQGASAAGTVTITMNNLATNQDACKGVTVPLYFLAS